MMSTVVRTAAAPGLRTQRAGQSLAFGRSIQMSVNDQSVRATLRTHGGHG